MKVFGGMGRDARNNRIDFGGDPGHDLLDPGIL